MQRFTNEMAETFHTSVWDRAEYLKKLSQFSIRGSYLDIGAQFGQNTKIFGEHAAFTVALDIAKFPEWHQLSKIRNTQMLVADAHYLPFRNQTFDAVTLISLIEHVRNPKQTVSEALRVLKSKGIMILQTPNKYFPLDLHSGLPFIVFMLPNKIRDVLLQKINYGWLKGVNLLSLKALIHMIPKKCKICIKQVCYPKNCVPPRFKKLHTLLARIQFLKIFPLGYLLSIKKEIE